MELSEIQVVSAISIEFGHAIGILVRLVRISRPCQSTGVPMKGYDTSNVPRRGPVPRYSRNVPRLATADDLTGPVSPAIRNDQRKSAVKLVFVSSRRLWHHTPYMLENAMKACGLVRPQIWDSWRSETTCCPHEAHL